MAFLMEIGIVILVAIVVLWLAYKLIQGLILLVVGSVLGIIGLILKGIMSITRRILRGVGLVLEKTLNFLYYISPTTFLRRWMGIQEAEYLLHAPTVLGYVKGNFINSFIGFCIIFPLLFGVVNYATLIVIVVFSIFIYLAKISEKATKIYFLIISTIFSFVFFLHLFEYSFSEILLSTLLFVVAWCCFKKYRKEKAELRGVSFWEKEIILKIGAFNGFATMTLFILLAVLEGGSPIFDIYFFSILLSGKFLFLRNNNKVMLYHRLCESTEEYVFLEKEKLQEEFLKVFLLNRKNVIMKNEMIKYCVFEYNKYKPSKEDIDEMLSAVIGMTGMTEEFIKTCLPSYKKHNLGQYDEFVQSKLYTIAMDYLYEIESIFEAAINKNRIYILHSMCVNMRAIEQMIEEIYSEYPSFHTEFLLKKIYKKNSNGFITFNFTEEDIFLLTKAVSYPLERAYMPSGKEIVYIDLRYVSDFRICDGCHCLISEPYEANGETFCCKECADFQTKCDKDFTEYKAQIAASNHEESSVCLSDDSSNLAEAVGAGIGVAENVNLAEETKMFSTPRGHGFAAEQANTLYDQVTLNNAKVIGGDNLKDGADRLVNGQLIQSKYCKTGSKCIAECFDGDRFRYVDGKGRPMQIEVPSDKYSDAVKAMENRIKRGQVPGVDDPQEAGRIVRKGHFSYEQAKNIAKAGTFESITFDTVKGVQIGLEAGAFTFLISFGLSLWNGKDKEKALQEAIYAAKHTLLQQGTITVLQEQSIKSALFKDGTKFIGSIVEKASSYVGLPKILAKELSGFLKSNTATITITVAVLSVGDIFRYFEKEITLTQLVRNVGKSTATVGGALVGGIAGVGAAKFAAGSLGVVTTGVEIFSAAAALSNPIGWVSIVGGMILGSSLGGKIGSWLGEKVFGDDEKERQRREEYERAEMNRRIEEMYPILKTYFAYLAEVYLLTDEECQTILKKIDDMGIQDLLLSIYEKENRIVCLNMILRPIFIGVTINRKFISEAESSRIERDMQQAWAS